MPRVLFTEHLSAFADTAPADVPGATVREAIDAALSGNDRLRTYLLDEQNRLRRHVAVFVEGKVINDRVNLSDPVGPDAEIYLMQALSGG